MIPKRDTLIIPLLKFQVFSGKVEALNEWLLLKQDYEQTMCQNFLFNKMLEVILKNENCQAYCCVTSMT